MNKTIMLLAVAFVFVLFTSMVGYVSYREGVNSKEGQLPTIVSSQNEFTPSCKYGLSIHMDQENKLAEMKEMGVCAIRTDLYWDWLGTPPHYYWGGYDARYQKYRDNGMEVMFILNNVNPAYNNNQNGGCWPTGTTDFNNAVIAFGDFAYQAALRYPDADFEILNEKNNPDACGRTMTPAQYTQILKVAYTKIKQANPNAIVYAPAVWSADLAWFEGMYQAGAQPYFDVLTVHPYEWKRFPDDPLSNWNKIKDVEAIMDKYCDNNKAIVVGELGTPTCGDGSVTEVGQANTLLLSFDLMSQNPRLKQMFWYSYKDDCENKNDRECCFGITTNDGQKKLAWCALQQVITAKK
jgi:polysaccharide biosynthesis protein PslG